MPLPLLEDWESTRTALHQSTQIVGAVRRLLLPERENHLHLAAIPLPYGLSSGVLPDGSQVDLDYKDLTLSYTSVDATVDASIPLVGQTKHSLAEELFEVMAKSTLKDMLGDAEEGTLTATVNAALEEKGSGLGEDGDTFEPDVETAGSFADIAWIIFQGIARFRARLEGFQTPLVVWPHGFDLSTLWFATEKHNETEDPHINVGFAPYTEGIAGPYLYAYAYPYPETYDEPRLPEGATWETDAFTGILLSYSTIARQLDPETYVQEACQAMYAGLRPLLP
ncbi:MAG: hypothetical protein GYB64_05820 [Chloroflexi bacterium]|nr:hypothetical protein [Chloroflexota bacterium]